MDWPRFQKAMEAERLESIEKRRLLFLDGKAQQDILDADEWETLEQHDEIVERWQQTNGFAS